MAGGRTFVRQCVSALCAVRHSALTRMLARLSATASALSPSTLMTTVSPCLMPKTHDGQDGAGRNGVAAFLGDGHGLAGSGDGLCEHGGRTGVNADRIVDDEIAGCHNGLLCCGWWLVCLRWVVSIFTRRCISIFAYRLHYAAFAGICISCDYHSTVFTKHRKTFTGFVLREFRVY